MNTLKIWGIFLILGISNTFAQSLYLGNNNVSCGRYTLTENSILNDVTNYCTVLNSKTKKNGDVVLKLQTINNGVIKCKFINGQLEKCHSDD
ncbi:hypothetical protein [Aquella oligotrophica]|uniref:Uncharacterized protein n=1 Tax=Aquella oligotrophica TaxID=2067065 RepID=A0A2I7N8L2_9NEIS|nr:hypothetical protein [Aquella oligotrophica]AUR52575.1 hypothetical protein CUN60_09790 [Aquella oligotrophica]